MPNIDACSHQYQSLSESFSMINRKSPLSSMKKTKIYELSTCRFDNMRADGRLLLISCLNIFGVQI